MITEKDNVFYCDCGFSFARGRSGTHDCAVGLRKRLAESEAKCAAIVAENVGLKRHASYCVNAIGFWNSWVDAEDKISTKPETQATDAFLAEVRARGVDALVERRLTAARLAKEAGHEITARDLEGEAIRARLFAMELRKGVQL